MRELVAAVVKNPASANWESWLTVLSGALTDEDAWMQAVESLSLEDQFGLLEALKTDSSIYSDALRVLTARHADRISDEEVRDFLLTDAAEATDRLTNRLEQHRDQLQDLIGKAQARREADFDLATEVVQLERQLHELRKSEIGEQFESMQQLDREIHRLETFKRSLEGYDPDARRVYRDQLDAETKELATRRTNLEDTIAAAIGRRDTLQREFATAEQQLAQLTKENDEITDRIAELRAQIQAATTELSEVRSQQLAVAGEAAELQQRIDDERRQLASEKTRLDELRSSPGAQKNQRLLAKIEEVYELLPADDAEAVFGS